MITDRTIKRNTKREKGLVGEINSGSLAVVSLYCCYRRLLGRFFGKSFQGGKRHVRRYGNYGNPRTPPQQPEYRLYQPWLSLYGTVVYWSLYPGKGKQAPNMPGIVRNTIGSWQCILGTTIQIDETDISHTTQMRSFRTASTVLSWWKISWKLAILCDYTVS